IVPPPTTVTATPSPKSSAASPGEGGTVTSTVVTSAAPSEHVDHASGDPTVHRRGDELRLLASQLGGPSLGGVPLERLWRGPLLDDEELVRIVRRQQRRRKESLLGCEEREERVAAPGDVVRALSVLQRDARHGHERWD